MNGAHGTIEKVKSVVRKLRQSNVESVKFKGFQEEEGLPQVELENFTTCKRSSSGSEAGELMLLKQLVNVLEPLKLATVAIQDRKAHIGLVLPVYFTLQKLLKGGDGTLQNV
ncbi:hypothetical protein AAVH_08725 [Aphelenchoides avenae]|nr:hypothetical protein AAVH_08725 [Aphelenchus avenae]